jgi:quinol monooxygenase YgiN
MSSNLDLIAIISPKAGKVDRVSLYPSSTPKPFNNSQVIELLQGVAVYVRENEPNTLKYEIVRQVNKKSGVEEIIMLERYVQLFKYLWRLVREKGHMTDGFDSYKDKNALNEHGSSAEFKKFNKTLQDEGLVGAPMQLKFVKAVGGFSRL